jgi:hypothetical protein
MPCPQGVDIPENFDRYNKAFLYDDVKTSQFFYQSFMKPEARSSSCIECGECEEKCPQHIPIREWLPKVTDLLAAK